MWNGKAANFISELNSIKEKPIIKKKYDQDPKLKIEYSIKKNCKLRVIQKIKPIPETIRAEEITLNQRYFDATSIDTLSLG